MTAKIKIIDLVYKTLNSDRYKQINFVYTY